MIPGGRPLQVSHSNKIPYHLISDTQATHVKSDLYKCIVINWGCKSQQLIITNTTGTLPSMRVDILQ